MSEKGDPMKQLMRKFIRKASSFFLSMILICSIPSVRVCAGFEIPGTCQVQADSGAFYPVKTLDYGYDHNTYFSLRDIAMILRDTDRRFSLDIAKSAGRSLFPCGDGKRSLGRPGESGYFPAAE